MAPHSTEHPTAAQPPKPLRAYAREALDLEQDTFCQRHPDAFLLYSTIASGRMTPVGMTRTPTVDRLVVGDTPKEKPVPVTPEDWYLVFELDSGHTTDGRLRVGCSSACDVRLDDTSVSRTHAWIIRARHGYYIEDARSSAGTAVNGETLEESKAVQLSTGDRISLGNIDLIFLPPGDFYFFVRRLAGGWDR